MAYGLLTSERTMTDHGARSQGVAEDGERGFTLVELMITVAIIAVLAILAGVGYARWVRTSKTGEATAMLAAIKGAEETYRAETYRYLDVSNCNGCAAFDPSGSGWYFPGTPPNDQRAPWITTGCAVGTVCGNFARLNITSDNTRAGVYYRYGVAAGGPQTNLTFDNRPYPVPYDPWFIVKAIGDLDANGTPSQYWTSSFDSTVWSVKPDE